MENAFAISSRGSGVKWPRGMRARDRFQFASSTAGEWPMHRLTFDTLAAPKTLVAAAHGREDLLRYARGVGGSTNRIVVSGSGPEPGLRYPGQTATDQGTPASGPGPAIEQRAPRGDQERDRVGEGNLPEEGDGPPPREEYVALIDED